MKLLHFGKFYPPFHGGMEVYLRDLAEQQVKTHTVCALVHNHDYAFLTSNTKVEDINGVEVIRQKCLKPILFTPIMLGVNRRVSQIIDQQGLDIIHISWPTPSALLLLLNKNAKSVPWVIQWQSDMVTEHSSWLLKLVYQLFKPLERALLKRASKVIVSTQEYFKHSNALSAFANKCVFIPLAMKQGDITIKPTEAKWAERLWNSAQYRIYSIGRLTFYKNHQLLINAAQLLPQAQFIITGQGELYKQLATQIKKLNLNNIALTGALSHDKLNALLASCDIFCLPSNDRAESYGMVLLEALNLNKKILVSNLAGSGMKWIAAQTALGQCFDCNDANDLVVKIVTFAKQTVAVQTHNNLAQFQMTACAKSMDQVYHSLLL
ncbi:MAG TPA: glycosyltransferase [Oceanospirillales bacterium]|nr:glycosyltransferase [Oceanospirillales bacterium]